jgi:hypothetical protein
MMRLLFDEDFNGDIVDGLRKRLPELDAVRVQEVGLRTASDAIVLEWAASEGRLLFTHDVRTMTAEAYQRVRLQQGMPGVFAVPQSLSIGEVIEDMITIINYSLPNEYVDQVRFLPLKR